MQHDEIMQIPKALFNELLSCFNLFEMEVGDVDLDKTRNAFMHLANFARVVGTSLDSTQFEQGDITTPFNREPAAVYAIKSGGYLKVYGNGRVIIDNSSRQSVAELTADQIHLLSNDLTANGFPRLQRLQRKAAVQDETVAWLNEHNLGEVAGDVWVRCKACGKLVERSILSSDGLCPKDHSVKFDFKLGPITVLDEIPDGDYAGEQFAGTPHEVTVKMAQHPSRYEKGFHPPLNFWKLGKAIDARSAVSFKTSLDWEPSSWGNALAGEVGEACNLLKKLQRGDKIDPRDIGKELADTVIYCHLTARSLGLILEDCVRNKFNEVSIRVGSSITL